MRKTVILDKQIGKTPLETIEEWKLAHPTYRDVPATYAGRLDPMASGKLLVLFGDECKKKPEYTKLDKTYDVEVLLGVGSDTGDILGIVGRAETAGNYPIDDIRRVLRNEVGTKTLAYPAFSSKTVGGKPLFLYALKGELDTITLPIHDETIYGIRLRKVTTMGGRELRERVTSLLALAPTSDEPSKALGADFRIKEVRQSWDTVFRESEEKYLVLRITVSCASGTYMRTLAGRLGASLGTKALALSIHRTKIGTRNWFWRQYF